MIMDNGNKVFQKRRRITAITGYKTSTPDGAATTTPTPHSLQEK